MNLLAAIAVATVFDIAPARMPWPASPRKTRRARLQRHGSGTQLIPGRASIDVLREHAAPDRVLGEMLN
jgi:hypothetical protein